LKQRDNELIFQNRIFFWIALTAAGLLLVPLVAMRLSAEVIWDVRDFVVMGFLLFVAGSSWVLAARRAPRRHRAFIGGMFIAALLYIWAELAVGVFTDLGS
jgi:hypothetical protein